MKRIFIVLIFLFYTTAVSANSIEQIKLDVRADGYTKVTQIMEFIDEGEYTLLKIPNNPKEISVKDSRGELEYTITKIDDEDNLKIYFRQFIESDQKEKITIKYGSHLLSRKDEENWKLKNNFETTGRKTIVKITFANGVKILYLNPQNLLRSYVENGIWIYPQDDELNFEITYRYDTSIMTTTTLIQDNQENESEMPYGNSGLILALVIALTTTLIYILHKNRLFGILKKSDISVDIANSVIANSQLTDEGVTYQIESKKTGPKNVKESILNLLNENELRIVRLLEQSSEDELTQANIQKTTGIPKSSLSDILKHIEKRKIIDRRVEGRVKWIKLRKWVLT